MRILHAGSPAVPEWGSYCSRTRSAGFKVSGFLSHMFTRQHPLAEKFCMLEQPERSPQIKFRHPTLSTTMYSRTRSMPSVISATATSNSPWRTRNRQRKHDKDLPIFSMCYVQEMLHAQDLSCSRTCGASDSKLPVMHVAWMTGLDWRRERPTKVSDY